ncbi:MAG TPA: 2-dehydropantoate 2-reductase N-terminal domain-containing protein, partial [Burkholderiaceae bacterium]
MKICIYGAGAIGGWIGVRLGRAGHTLSVVARDDTLHAIQTHGLRLAHADGSVEQVTAQASDTPQALGPQDLVVLVVKAPALAAVASRIAPLLAPH